jgi:hypothetical protein
MNNLIVEGFIQELEKIKHPYEVGGIGHVFP